MNEFKLMCCRMWRVNIALDAYRCVVSDRLASVLVDTTKVDVGGLCCWHLLSRFSSGGERVVPAFALPASWFD